MKSFIAKKTLGSFIGGKFVSVGTKFQHHSVVTDEKLANIHKCRQADVKSAISAAASGQKRLDKLSAYERSELLHKIGDLLLEYKKEIAFYITHEMGKTLKEAEGEVVYTAGYFHWNAEEAVRILEKRIPSRSSDKKLLMMLKRIGPCFFVSPWNFPLAMAGRKVAPAIATGCSCIVKPCREAPLSMLVLAHIGKLAKLPPGALNILIGDHKTISPPIMDSPIIKKLSFTGSVEAGKTLYQQSAKTLKKVTMELGGNAPFIVFDDADLDLATDQAIFAKFRNAGQTCVAANRFLIQKTVLDDFLKLLKQKISKLKIGSPLNKSVFLTNILHPTSVEKMKKHIKDAIRKGAKPLLKAKQPFEPEILLNVKKNMLVYKLENFGPVIPIITFNKDQEAIKIANDTKDGLAAYAFTTSLKRSYLVTNGLEFGMIGLNDGLFSAPEASFGGMKDSGFGKEGGPDGIYEYLVETMVSEKI